MLALFRELKWKNYHPAVLKTARHMVVAGCWCLCSLRLDWTLIVASLGAMFGASYMLVPVAVLSLPSVCVVLSVCCVLLSLGLFSKETHAYGCCVYRATRWKPRLLQISRNVGVFCLGVETLQPLDWQRRHFLTLYPLP